jgi:hypothetical protein
MNDLFKKIRLAAGTLKDVAKGAIEGKDLTVSTEEKDRRLNICKACPMMVELAGTLRCNSCGCYMNLKTALTKARCPEGRW